MHATITKKLTRNSFLLSLVIHLLLLIFLLMISTIITRNPVEITKKSPQLYVPSYVYKGAITPAIQHSITQNTPQSQPTAEAKPSAPPIQKVQAPSGTLPSTQKNMAIKKIEPFKQKSVLDMSRNFITHNQVDSALSNLNNSEPPILLIGDRHAIVDPLVKLVGRSLSAHFHYPRIQGTFGARGRVYIELVLHPEGYFSDVQIVQSSEIEDFNAAALYAVNTAPTVVGVDKFLPKAKRFVVGFIFE